MSYISFLKAIDHISQYTDRALGSVQVSFLSMIRTKKAVEGKDYQLAVGYGQINSKIYVATRTLMHDCINAMQSGVTGVTTEDKDKMHALIGALPETTLPDEIKRVLVSRGKPIPKNLFEQFQQKSEITPEIQELQPIQAEPLPSNVPTESKTVIEVNINHKVTFGGVGVIRVEGMSGGNNEELLESLNANIKANLAKMFDPAVFSEAALVQVRRNILETVSDPDTEFSKALRRQMLLTR
jgi:hypothetical protein